MSRTVERRKHPRRRVAVQSRITGEKTSSECVTVDLSANGLSCQLDRPLGLFTKVKITLMVPKTNGANHGGKPEPVECEGVVVRCEADEKKKGNHGCYSTAIFFNHIDSEAMDHIQRYVASHRH